MNRFLPLAAMLAGSAIAASAQPTDIMIHPGASVSAPSHVFARGGVEILTFETEQNYDRLQELCRESEGVQPEPGRLTTLYYRSDSDGSAQPYAVWLPPGYSAGRRYPLVLQLHGTNFHEVLSGQRLTYRGMGTAQWIPPDLPVIYAQCFGGPETFYFGVGEEDVLRVMAEMERRFSVDPDRVYLMGHSMGGAGSYTIGLHHPELFAGITMMDPALWTRKPPTADLPAWMLPQIAASYAPSLYPNGLDLEMFFKNAGLGIQRNSTTFSEGINAQGGHATTQVIPGVPHAFGDKYAYAHFVPELIGARLDHHPAEVKFYTNTLRYDRAYWVTIDRLTRPGADSLVKVACKPGSVDVSTENLDALTLNLSEAPLAKEEPVAITVDGQTVDSGTAPCEIRLSRQSGAWRLGAWKADGLAKRHGLQGPIGDAFNTRFLAVSGAGDRDLAISELDAIRNPLGPEDIQGDFPMKVASAVTAEDVASSNLILFGTEKSNPIIKRIAGSLPSALLRPGSVFIYPNPENPARYVVIWSAKVLSTDSGVMPASWLHSGPMFSALWIPPLNRLPDYVRVENGKIVRGGLFDDEWRPAP